MERARFEETERLCTAAERFFGRDGVVVVVVASVGGAEEGEGDAVLDVAEFTQIFNSELFLTCPVFQT